ncbi:MAG: hypothetical protein IJF38_06775, partial [Clostridia bacterium]|nr:hypothetical protein [Clostridia bacterium]
SGALNASRAHMGLPSMQAVISEYPIQKEVVNSPLPMAETDTNAIVLNKANAAIHTVRYSLNPCFILPP